MAEVQANRGKSERVGKLRCPNCFERFQPSPGAERTACPGCGWEWYISWVGTLAKIRKPVWEKWEQQLAEIQESVDSSQ